MISRATNYLSSLSFSFTRSLKTHQLNLTNATVIVVIL